ncbi:unnamed protein product, partial [Discosporangium mesarthrocarpum]
MAMDVLMSCTSGRFLRKVCKAEAPNIAWKEIRANFTVNSASEIRCRSTVGILKSRMVRGSDPQDLWLKIDVDLDQLEVMGAPMEETQVRMAMVNGLDDDYAMVKKFQASVEDVTREQIERLVL